MATTTEAAATTVKEVVLNEKVEELDRALRTMTLKDINEDYSNWSVEKASKKDVALLHGSATMSLVKSETDKTKVESVLSTLGKKPLNYDIHLETMSDGTITWLNTKGETVTTEQVQPAILKHLNSIKNGFSLTINKKSSGTSSAANGTIGADTIKFIYSGDHTRYSEPDNKTQLLATKVGEYMNCHVYNPDTGKYIFMGKLKLVHVMKIEVPHNSSIVTQYLFYFA